MSMDETGPQREPHLYLSELREHGFTVLDGLVDQAALQRIREATLAETASLETPPPRYDDRFGVPNGISWSKDICRAVTHPVALQIIRDYLGTPNIHFCHQPAMTVLCPSKDLIGTYPDSGWHSDYPYHPDVFPQEHWQDDAVYGVQFNICIDEFRLDNAATQYVPGSHLEKRWPPVEMNEGGTRAGIGPHEKVEQMTAPAGSALIYDSRTWHRACVELNVSGENRLAILNAVCPSWIRPMVDKTSGSNLYHESGMDAQLDDRTRDELHRLCHQETIEAPSGAPHILEKPQQPRRINI